MKRDAVLPPHSLEAEQAVLGSLLIDRDAILNVAAGLQARDFYRHAHGLIYQAVMDLYWRREPTDLVTLVAELTNTGKLDDAGGETYLAELMAAVPTSVHAGYYMQIVADHATRRRVIDGAQTQVSLAYNTSLPLQDVISGAEEALGSAVTGFNSEAVVGMEDLTARFLANLDREMKAPATFGFPDLDELVYGLHPGNLMIVGARPAVGKSSWMVQVAAHNALNANKTVLIVSLEMSAGEIHNRLVSSLTNIDNRKVDKGRALSDTERQAVEQANQVLQPLPLYIYDKSTGQIEDVVSRVRDLHARHGLDLLMIDYVQLMNSGRFKNDRVQEVSHISRSLKQLAMQMEIPVIALAQLSRAAIDGKGSMPQLNHLRESGSLEQDADLVMFLHRPADYDRSDPPEIDPSLSEWIVAKHRNGPTGMVSMKFDGKTTRFYQSSRELVPAISAKPKRYDEFTDVPF